MAHINFLEPPRFSLQQFNLKNFELNYFWMMVIAGVLLVFMLTYGMVQRHRVSSFNVDLAAALAEAKAASGARTTGSGQPQKPTLMDALRQRVVWSPILNAIANHTPDTVSLNYIKGNTTGSRTVQLEGMGADVLSAARYEDELSAVPFFSKVMLQSSSQKEATASTADKSDAKSENKLAATGGGGQLTFEIQGWLK
jgi:hypothetical protein